jgi:hypothetical protein
MHEVYEVFKAIRAQAKADRVAMREVNIGLLHSYDVEFMERNRGLHCIVTTKAGVWDFYPSTEKFKKRGDLHFRSGAEEFFVAAGILSETGSVLCSRV